MNIKIKLFQIKTKRFIETTNKLLILTLLVLVTLSCGNESIARLNPIDDEANTQAQQYWSSIYTKCGDTFVTAYETNYNSIIVGSFSGFYAGQITAPQISTTGSSRPLLEADKLNGVEWIGSTIVSCESLRLYKCENTKAQCEPIGDWKPCPTNLTRNRLTVPIYPISVKKIKGSWQFKDPSESELSVPDKPYDCSKIPSH
jgi:hypothetical protein